MRATVMYALVTFNERQHEYARGLVTQSNKYMRKICSQNKTCTWLWSNMVTVAKYTSL